MVDNSQPAAMNPYAYSNNARAMLSDSDGLFFPILIGIVARKAAQALARRLGRGISPGRCAPRTKLECAVSAAGQQPIESVLLSVHEQHRLLDEFAVRCFLAFEFGEESEVTRQLLIDKSDGHPRLTLHHSFRIVDWEKSQEHSELNFDVALTFTDADCTVEASVIALLEWQMGEFGVGTHTFYRAFDSHLPLDDALAIFAERVAQLCALGDVPGRLGLRQS